MKNNTIKKSWLLLLCLTTTNALLLEQTLQLNPTNKTLPKLPDNPRETVVEIHAISKVNHRALSFFSMLAVKTVIK